MLTLVAVVTLVLIPLCVAFLLSFQFIVTDTSNEWIGFWGGYLGSFIGGIITLYVLFKTLEDNKQNLERTLEDSKTNLEKTLEDSRINLEKTLESENKRRRLDFCNEIIHEISTVSNHATIVTLTTQKFLYSAKESYRDKVFREKNKFLDEVWILIVKLEAKRETYPYSKELYNNLSSLAECINSFSVNDLQMVDDNAPMEVANELILSAKFKETDLACRNAAKAIEKLLLIIADNMKLFYNENTKDLF